MFKKDVIIKMIIGFLLILTMSADLPAGIVNLYVNDDGSESVALDKKLLEKKYINILEIE